MRFIFLIVLVLLSISAVQAEEKKQEESSMESLKKKVTSTERNIEKMPKMWSRSEKYNDAGHEKKIIWINETIYEELIFDSVKAKYVATKPYFLMFVNAKYDSSNMHRKAMIDLAGKYGGDIQFAVSNIVLDEKLTLAYDITTIMEEGPRAFLIDSDGMAYYYNSKNYTVEDVSEWIDGKKYQNSPSKFKVPAVLGEYKIYWAYAKKDVRAWFKKNIQPFIEPYLIKFKVSYMADLDPEDVVNIKPEQKINRQILFLIAGIAWIFENIWDMLCAKPAKPTKKKSLISSKKKKDVKEEDENKDKNTSSPEKKKGKREKIE